MKEYNCTNDVITDWDWHEILPVRNLFSSLLYTAVKEETDINHDTIMLQRGQIITNPKLLSKSSGDSECTVRWCLEVLAKSGAIIITRPIKRYIIITVRHFDLYFSGGAARAACFSNN